VFADAQEDLAKHVQLAGVQPLHVLAAGGHVGVDQLLGGVLSRGPLVVQLLVDAGPDKLI
jgi:hypothetical protein